MWPERLALRLAKCDQNANFRATNKGPGRICLSSFVGIGADDADDFRLCNRCADHYSRTRMFSLEINVMQPRLIMRMFTDYIAGKVWMPHASPHELRSLDDGSIISAFRGDVTNAVNRG